MYIRCESCSTYVQTASMSGVGRYVLRRPFMYVVVARGCQVTSVKTLNSWVDPSGGKTAYQELEYSTLKQPRTLKVTKVLSRYVGRSL